MTIISVVATGAGTVLAVVGLVSRSIGNLRSHMDQRFAALITDANQRTHDNQRAHDAIRLRIDNPRGELGGRIDAQGADLLERIAANSKRLDRVEIKVSRMGEDVAFIKGWVTAQPEA